MSTANIGSFFSGFGQAFGEALQSHQKAKRDKKNRNELIAIDRWTKVLSDPEAADDERQFAGQELARLTGVKELSRIPGLLPKAQLRQEPTSLLSQSMDTDSRRGHMIFGPPLDQHDGPGPQMPARPPSLGSAIHSIPPTGPSASAGIFEHRTAEENPLYPAVTKANAAQAPRNLITLAMPHRPAALSQINSEAERRRQAEFERQQQMTEYQSQLRLSEFQQELQLRQQAAAGELGQMVGTIDVGGGEVAAVFVNPINSERTVVKLGMPPNEFMQKLQALQALKGTVSLDDDDVKKVIFGISPTGPEAQAAQDAKDWIDSKNPDPNISGPAQLRLEAARAGINATNALTATRQAELSKPSEKQRQAAATKAAIQVFSGKYKKDFVLRKQQEHLQNLLDLGEQALAGMGPEAQQLASLLQQAKGDHQALARIAMQLAEKDSQNYFQHLAALKRDEGQGLEVIHIEEIRKKAAQAQALGKDPSVVWTLFKIANGQEIIIVDDDLQPWSGQAEPGQGFQEVSVGAKGKEVKPTTTRSSIPIYSK